MKCLTCKNRVLEIPAELTQIAEEMRKYYSQVIYCNQLGALIVSNPGNPAQEVSECEKYEGQSS